MGFKDRQFVRYAKRGGIKWLFMKLRRAFSVKSGNRSKLPKKISDSEKTACSIFLNLLKNPSSKMHFDGKTSECGLSDKEKTLYVFLESRNLKIINTVFGYDTPIQPETEVYLGDRFIQELARRRAEFKAEAMLKVEHSLHKTLDKLTESILTENLNAK